HRTLPEPTQRYSRLGSGLEHALHHVLRVLLPAGVGDGGGALAMGPAPAGVSRHPVAGPRVRRRLRGLLSLLHGAALKRTRRMGWGRAQSAALPLLPAGPASPLRRGDRAPLPRDADGGGR